MFDIAAVSMLAFGAAGSFAPYIQMFNVMRFAQAMATAGLQTLSAALCKSSTYKFVAIQRRPKINLVRCARNCLKSLY